MKHFFKMVFASVVGTMTTLGFMFFIFVAIVAGVASTGEEQDWGASLGQIKDKSILRVEFNGPIVDYVERRDLMSSVFDYDAPPMVGLYELTQTLKDAGKNDKIKGLFLDIKFLGGGMANVEALRREIVKFKATGKFVIAYAEVYSEKSYVVASAADEVILYPRGYFEWDGMYSKSAFFKNTLKKLDVVPQIFRVGKYKSAIEPFINDKMSPESREQIQSLILNAWGQVSGYAAEKTQLDKNKLEDLANNVSVIQAKQAFENGFVNFLSSFEDVERKLIELTGVEKKPEYVGWRSYYKNMVKESKKAKGDKIAIVFAQGEIVTSGDKDRISSEKFSKLLQELSREEDVKAVVIRVNSPGGSALASDVIWTSTQWLKDKKPVVTSFGNVAASGGYYMSAGSNYIFAEPTTITGSIGVFGLSFATQKFWNDRVGVTFDTEKSHRFSDLESLVRTLDPEEFRKMQSLVDNIYGDFLNVVVQGRSTLETTEQVHEIAQGRVWSGKEAKNIGLVDAMGGIDDAVVKAAEFAKITDYTVEVFPKAKSPVEEFLMQFGDVSMKLVKSVVPASLVKIFKTTDEKSQLSESIYTRIPFDITVH